jgi:putative transposase
MSRSQIHKVKLNHKQKQELLEITRCGKRPVRQVKKAQMLLFANEGKMDTEIAKLLHVTARTVQATRLQFCQEGMGVLKRKPVPGRPKKIDGRVEAEIMVIALSDPPKGQARWTLRRIADQVVELNVIPSISHHSIGRTLKKKKLNLGLQRSGKFRLKQMGILPAKWKM